MRMYPAYTLNAVLNEYCVRFFYLLNEGYRLKIHDLTMLAYTVRATQSNDDKFAEYIKQLEYASLDISDILEPDEDETDPDKANKLLRG